MDPIRRCGTGCHAARAAVRLDRARCCARPTTDEAVYVNLDAYGALDDMRVVKGVTLNGAAIADYGDYEAVYNMTSHDKPALRADGVDFTLENVTGSRFYYECIPSDPSSLQMPWTFDVSYKLDGVPMKAEDLAGASGLVEMPIHAIPNPAAGEYYRNNMTLILGTGANMMKPSPSKPRVHKSNPWVRTNSRYSSVCPVRKTLHRAHRFGQL